METEFKSKFGNKVSHTSTWDIPMSNTSVWYNIMCDCCSEDHDTTMEFEYDKDMNMLFLSFYKTINYSKEFSYVWDDDTLVDTIKNRIEVIWRRLKDATKLLFTGYVEMDGDFILQDKQHIQDFIDALIEGRDFCLGKNPPILINDESITDNDAGC